MSSRKEFELSNGDDLVAVTAENFLSPLHSIMRHFKETEKYQELSADEEIIGDLKEGSVSVAKHISVVLIFDID